MERRGWRGVDGEERHGLFPKKITELRKGVGRAGMDRLEWRGEAWFTSQKDYRIKEWSGMQWMGWNGEERHGLFPKKITELKIGLDWIGLESIGGNG